MSTLPLVSIILPVYNGEPYLKAAIDSLLNQDYLNYELIVINDGSKDTSWQTIEGIQDSRVRAFSQENRGLPATLNRAIELANGELIARADQDDLSHPMRLSKQAAFLTEHPDIGIVGTAYRLLTPQDEIIGTRVQLTTPVQVKRHLFTGNPFCHGSVMFRKSVVQIVNAYDASAKMEDYELWSRLVDHTQMANLPDVLYDYRTNVSTSMVSTNKDRYRTETDRIRNVLWSNGRPPRIWEDFAPPWRAAFPAVQDSQTRSPVELQVTVGLGIARQHRQRGAPRRAVEEMWGLLLMHAFRPRQVARIVRHIPTVFMAGTSEVVA